MGCQYLPVSSSPLCMWSSQVEVFRLQYSIFEISIQLPGSGFGGQLVLMESWRSRVQEMEGSSGGAGERGVGEKVAERDGAPSG